MSGNATELCSDARMREILEASTPDNIAGIATIDAAIADFPGDARLHFLKGSLLISEKRFIAAHAALSRAVALAPEFHLARFQLGFFELTSGEADTALATWQPLHQLPDGIYFRTFAEGLEHLIADRFVECIAALRAGIAINAENEPLNNDMRLIIARCEELIGGSAAAATGESGAEAISATSFLLGSIRRPN